MGFLLRPILLIAFISLLIGSLLFGLRVGQRRKDPKTANGANLFLSGMLIAISFTVVLVLLFILK